MGLGPSPHKPDPGGLPVANPGISSWNIQVQCSIRSHNESVASSTRRVPDQGFSQSTGNTLRTRQPVTHLRAGPGICTGSPL